MKEFIESLDRDIAELRPYLAALEGTMRVGRNGVDRTPEEIASVKEEIRRLEDAKRTAAPIR